MPFHIILLTAENSELWTAIGTMTLAVITFFAIGVQIYWNRRVLNESRSSALTQMTLLQNQLQAQNENSFKFTSVKLAEIFEVQFQDLIQTRKECSSLILQNHSLDQNSIDYSPIKEKIDDIYDLFDTIGYFVRHKYIKAEVAHQYFDYWFTPYYTFFQLYQIKSISGYDEAVWNNLANLSMAMDRVEIDQVGYARKPVTKEKLKEFFEQEEKL
jgi:hypothetical protein